MGQTSETETICFERNPCGMLILGMDRSILQLNAALASMFDLPADCLVGKNHQTLKPAAYQNLLRGKGLMHLAGPGIEQEKWFFCTEFEGSAGIVKFYQDVTEQLKMKQQISALQQQVEDLTITDELTGLANPRALNRALNSQVTRSRRYQNPLCLAVMELVDTDDPAATLSDDAILATSRHLRDRLRWADTIARWDQNHFVVILPETNTEDGSDLIAKICAGLSDIEIPSQQKSHTLELRFGLAQWLKGNDSRILMERAAQALNSHEERQLETAVT